VGYFAEYEPQRSPKRTAVVRGRARVAIVGLAHAVAPKSRYALCGRVGDHLDKRGTSWDAVPEVVRCPECSRRAR
jgi:hypothetical protein